MANSHESFPDWHQHEKDISDMIQADQTTASGSVWYDKTDVTTREHPLDREVQFQADGKSTHFSKYSIDVHFMEENRLRAVKTGKIFLLPVRFELTPDRHEKYDYVVLSMDDFRFVTGLDEVKSMREKDANRKNKEAAFKNKISAVIESLYNMAADNKLSCNELNIIYKACDALDEGMNEL
jgi:hypothetical protein